MTRSRNSARARTRVAASPPGSDPRAGETSSSSTRTACTMRAAARSSPSAYSRPSKPAPAPPRWSSISTAPTSTTMTGTRSSPDAFRLSRARGAGWPWRARMDREGHANVRRKLIIQARPRETDACYASHCFFRVLLSVETFCVNGRSHATTRRRFLSHFPGNDEPRVGAFAYDFAPTSSIRGRDSCWAAH